MNFMGLMYTPSVASIGVAGWALHEHQAWYWVIIFLVVSILLFPEVKSKMGF